MKISLILVGKTDKGWIRDGLDIYCGRLGHYVGFDIFEIPELKNAGAMSRDSIKQKEGELILGRVKDSDYLVLLDEHGKEYSSIEFSSVVSRDMQRGRNVVYVIGGAYGFSPDVYARANDKISLSRMTFSHQMVRVIFTEQLYRAYTILAGEPYHHE